MSNCPHCKRPMPIAPPADAKETIDRMRMLLAGALFPPSTWEDKKTGEPKSFDDREFFRKDGPERRQLVRRAGSADREAPRALRQARPSSTGESSTTAQVDKAC